MPSEGKGRTPARWVAAGVALAAVALAAAVLARQNRGEDSPGSSRSPGSVSQGPSLQQLIDEKCRNGGVVELSGRYVIDETLLIEGCRDLTIEGNGALLETEQLGPFTDGTQPEDKKEADDERDGEQRGTGDDEQAGQGGKRQESKRVHVLIASSSDIVVRNVTVRGPNRTDDPKVGRPGVAVYDARYAKEHGFSIQGSSQVRLENNRVEMVFGDGVNMGREPNSDVVVSGLRVERNGRQGVHVGHVSKALIERVEVVNGRRGGVDFEPAGSSWLVEDVEVRDSTFRTQLLAFPAVGGKGQVRNVRIHGNTVLSARSFLAVNGGHSGFEIYDNTASDLGTYEGAMVAIGPNVENIEFRNNRLEPRAPDRPAFSVEKATGVRITGNDVSPASVLAEGDLSSSLVCSNTTASGDEQPVACPS